MRLLFDRFWLFILTVVQLESLLVFFVDSYILIQRIVNQSLHKTDTHVVGQRGPLFGSLSGLPDFFARWVLTRLFLLLILWLDHRFNYSLLRWLCRWQKAYELGGWWKHFILWLITFVDLWILSNKLTHLGSGLSVCYRSLQFLFLLLVIWVLPYCINLTSCLFCNFSKINPAWYGVIW